MSQTDVQQIHIRAYLYRTDIETNTHFLLVVHIKKIRQIEWIFESGACTSQTAIATQPKSRAATKGGKIIVNTIEKLEKHGAHIHTVSNSTENYDIHSFRIIFIVLFVAIKGVFFPFWLLCCFLFRSFSLSAFALFLIRTQWLLSFYRCAWCYQFVMNYTNSIHCQHFGLLLEIITFFASVVLNVVAVCWYCSFLSSVFHS